MPGRPTEDEVPISPRQHSPLGDEICSSKKLFFLNSYSESLPSEPLYMEPGDYPRDEVSRRLFRHTCDCCDCDCSSGGCWGCLRRNRQCFFKFFVLALSIALILLLFGSLSYNLTRNKAANESYDFENTEWVSHDHEYQTSEEKNLLQKSENAPVAPVLDLPAPVYEHIEDYDSREDLRKLRYHLTETASRGSENIEPISFPLLNTKIENSRDRIPIIYDTREPPRIRRSLQEKIKLKRESDLDPETFFEELNEVNEGMEKFWELYYKKGKTVFEPFSLTTPGYSTPMPSYEESKEEEDIAHELENKFLSEEAVEHFVTTTESTEIESEDSSETTDGNLDSTDSKIEVTQSVERERIISFTNIYEYLSAATEDKNKLPESAATEDTSSQREIDSTVDAKEFRTWPVFHFSAPLEGLYGSSQQDQISADPALLDTVKGISLVDAKKIKKERRKHMLLNSRVVGGSSDVRLPTGPDISKPFVNAFETLKTNQQLSFTPSAASQFILPHQMCLFAAPFPGPRPSVHAAQPRTFSLGIPSIFDKDLPPKNPYQVPVQQNFLSFSINNYPNAPRQPTQPSGGSVLNYPSPQQFSQIPGPNKQPIFCTYLQPPLFQFPTVPGTADFSHAKCVDCQDDSQKHSSAAKEFSPSGREILCTDDKVSCMDGSSCVPLENWCDNRVHCKDASDEAFCSCRERVARDRLCDGYVDCPHGEDETGCFDCPKSAFSCDSVISPESCIPLSKRCDGIRDCSTGADEDDCSALFFNVRQNDSYHVSQAAGYLHRNWKGDWFPVCVEIGESVWAEEACLGELGVASSGMEVRFAPVSTLYRGPFIVRKGDGTATVQDHCKGHVSTFVKCPTMNCGTRIERYYLQEIENRYVKEEARKDKLDSFRQERNLEAESNVASERNVNDSSIDDSRLKREETGRVVGGRASEPKAWPWAIAVYKNGAFHCGGVILDKNWVLTAAHCMEQYWKHYYEVRGGMLRRFSFSAMEQARTVSHVIIHENYDLTIMSNDIALLRLEEPFHFNRWVRPACLPFLKDGVSKFVTGPAPGTRCTAVGWGALRERGTDPDQLREVEIPIMVRCKHKEDLVGEEICAGKVEGGKDTCQGDSGGPLLCRDSGIPASWYVAGIVSHGEGCARPGEPGAYTRISLFVDWITSKANDFMLPTVRPLKTCPGFRCHSASRLCIPHKWVCNGYTDCLEAEDEKNCTSESVSNIFNYTYSSGYRYFEDAEAETSVQEPATEKSLVTEVDLKTHERIVKIKEEPKKVSPNTDEFSTTESGLKETNLKDEERNTDDEEEYEENSKDIDDDEEKNYKGTNDDEVEDNDTENLVEVENYKKVDTTEETNKTEEENDDEENGSGTKSNETDEYENDTEEDTKIGGSSLQVLGSQENSEATDLTSENTVKWYAIKSSLQTSVPLDDYSWTTESTSEGYKIHTSAQTSNPLEESSLVAENTIENSAEGYAMQTSIETLDALQENSAVAGAEPTESNFREYKIQTMNDGEEFEAATERYLSGETEFESNVPKTTVSEEDFSVGFLTEKLEEPFITTIQEEEETTDVIVTAVTTPLQNYLQTTKQTEFPTSIHSLTTFPVDAATVISGRNSDLNVDTKYFQCGLIVQSILASFRCDGYEDCEDGTDEKNCSKCNNGEFYCKNSDQCISRKERCDGRVHCKSEEDETKCLALAKSGQIVLDESGEPFLETEGVLTVNQNGVWSLKCQEKAFSEEEAMNVCSSLGTIGYERYENRSLGLNCTGFHVTCANILISSTDRYKSSNGNYLWPWYAFVFSDDKPVCSAVLFQPKWLLTSSNCLQGVSFEKNYLFAKLGAANFSSRAKEAGVKTIRIDGAHLISDSDIALLHLSKEVSQTEFIRLLGVSYSFESDSKKDLCVAVGDRTVFLKTSDECSENLRCYRKLNPTPLGCRSEPWVGVTVCQSRFGWYPASVFSEKSGHCGFEEANFTSLEKKLPSIHRALEKPVKTFPEPVCKGFRCSQGLCIPRSKMCNGWPDCTSGEDENFQLCKSNAKIKECKVIEMKCRNGRCIPKVLFGDGKDDCGDESDEPSDVTCAQYLRLTTPEKICDGKRNCYDKTDEDYKLCSCDGEKFQCKLSGYCIPNDFVCDNEEDCPGGEDEKQCMGWKIFKNGTKTHLEILKKSYGIWHSVCSNSLSKQHSNALCRDLGFKEALTTFDRNQTVLVPEIHAFSWVKLNQKTNIALRRNRPFVKLVASNRTCSSVKCA